MMSEFLDSSWDRVRLVTLDTLADNLIVPANGEVLSDTLQGGPNPTVHSCNSAA